MINQQISFYKTDFNEINIFNNTEGCYSLHIEFMQNLTKKYINLLYIYIEIFVTYKCTLVKLSIFFLKIYWGKVIQIYLYNSSSTCNSYRFSNEKNEKLWKKGGLVKLEGLVQEKLKKKCIGIMVKPDGF